MIAQRNSVNTSSVRRHTDPCRAFATVAPAPSNTSHWTALLASDTAAHSSPFPGGPSVRSQEPSLQAIRDLCRQRKLSHAGAHTHGDIKVDHQCRSARVLVDTCDAIGSMAAEIELSQKRKLVALTTEVQRLRVALADWHRVFGGNDGLGETGATGGGDAAAAKGPRRRHKPMTPAALAAELTSLRVRVKDLEAENASLRRDRDSSSTQLAQVLRASRPGNV